MKILYLTQYFSRTRGGGGESVFFDLANGMARRGDTVNVISHLLAPDHEQICDIGNMLKIYRIKPVIDFRQGFFASSTQNLGYIINSTLKGSQIIRKEKVDLIHANNLSPTIAGSLLSSLHRVPLVITIHDVFTHSDNFWKKWSSQDNVSHITSIIGPIFEKLTLNIFYDAIHTVSNSTRDDLEKYGIDGSKIRVIHNGIDYRRYDLMKVEKRFESYVLFIGRLVFYKNVEVLVRSFKEVVIAVPKAKLIIVGDGPMLGQWERLAHELGLHDSVKFTGFVSDREKLELLGNSSSLLLPSLVEGFGMVLLEAFAMSKPVIVSDVRPYDEVVSDGVDGFIVPANDPHKWAEKIILLMSNTALCEEMGRTARLKAERQFSLDHTIERMQTFYTNICTNRLP